MALSDSALSELLDALRVGDGTDERHPVLEPRLHHLPAKGRRAGRIKIGRADDGRGPGPVRDPGECRDAILGEAHGHALGGHQLGILAGQRIIRFGQDADEIGLGQRLQLDPGPRGAGLDPAGVVQCRRGP